MTSKILVSALAILLVAACGTPHDSQTKIIGGDKAPNLFGEKGIWPATIGIQSNNLTGCTAVRISKVTFATAGHCFTKVADNEEVTVLASNVRKFTAHYRKIKAHPTFAVILAERLILGSDVSLFELAFHSREERAIFDGFVDVSPLDFGIPSVGDSVTIAGWGCEYKIGAPSFKCDKYPGYSYMKWASNKILTPPYALGTKQPERNFELDASSDKPGINGFVSDGDSGGPVYNSSGALIGITSSGGPAILTGEDAFFGATKHAWIGYTDVKPWIEDALRTESIAPEYYVGLANISYVNGDVYIGSVSNGLRNGQGNMQFKDMKLYSGSWVNDTRSGCGEQTWPAGTKYVSYKGDWGNDLPNGKGIMVFTSGQVYSGTFKDARFEGEGQLTYANGDIRVGNFVANK